MLHHFQQFLAADFDDFLAGSKPNIHFGIRGAFAPIALAQVKTVNLRMVFGGMGFVKTRYFVR